MTTLSYCGELVKTHDRRRFMLSLFVPPPVRESLWVLYALDVELAHIRRAVQEEMIGHIRLSWWQEALEALYAGTLRQGHPILEALFPLVQAATWPEESLLALVKDYREHFPNPPQHNAERIESLSCQLLQKDSPETIPVWQRAYAIVSQHGKGRNGWLALKLLKFGLFGH